MNNEGGVAHFLSNGPELRASGRKIVGVIGPTRQHNGSTHRGEPALC